VIVPAVLLVAAAALGPAQAGDLEALLDEGRYAEALASIEGLDGLERHRGRVRVLHHAGDLLGAFEAGVAGLEQAPGDLALLLATVDVALVLGAPAAIDLSERLDAAVSALPADTQHRSWWEDKAREFGALAAAQTGSEQVREGVEQRARWVAGLGLAAAGLALLALSRKRAPAK